MRLAVDLTLAGRFCSRFSGATTRLKGIRSRNGKTRTLRPSRDHSSLKNAPECDYSSFYGKTGRGTPGALLRGIVSVPDWETEEAAMFVISRCDFSLCPKTKTFANFLGRFWCLQEKVSGNRGTLPIDLHKSMLHRMIAGKGNRTLIASLEGWSFTIKLCPRFAEKT